MVRRSVIALMMLVSTSVVAVGTAGDAAADGPNLCQFGSKYKKSASTKFEPGPPAFSMTIDNRHNPQAQVETWTVTKSTKITKSTKTTGSVETSISVGLKALAEQKVDVAFSHERSTEKEVSVSVTTSSQRSFPANTWSTWTRGIYTVTAKAVHLCWKPSHQVWVNVGRQVSTWPVMNGWKFKVIKKG